MASFLHFIRYFLPEYPHAITERTAQTIAVQMHGILTILLKSRKPPPVTEAAHTAAKTAITAKITLIILKTVFFFMTISPF